MHRGFLLGAGLVLTGLVSSQTTGAKEDESDVAQKAVSLPVVDRGSSLAEYTLFTGKAHPAKVERAIGKVLDGRSGWKRDASGWHYSAWSLGPGRRYLTVNVAVYRGRAMLRKDARPQSGVWTTVEVSMDHRGVGSYAMPHPEWVVVTDPKEDAALNVPVGEERNLGKLIGLPLVAHRSTYGTPWWIFTGPMPRKVVEARVARALTGRRGWNPSESSGSINGVAFRDRNWSYLSSAPFPLDRRPTDRALFLVFQTGKASPIPLKSPLTKPWTTVTVQGGGHPLNSQPVGIWNVYR